MYESKKYDSLRPETTARPQPQVTVTRGFIGDGVYESQKEVILIRTLTPEDEAERALLVGNADKGNFTDSGAWEEELGRLTAFDNARTEVILVDNLRTQARTDQLAYQRCQELGIEVY